MENRSERSQVRRSAADVAEAAKNTAGELAGTAKDVATERVQGFFDQGKGAAVSQIGAVANALRNASSELEGQQEPLARAVRRAADTIENFSHSIEQRDFSGALESAQDYARRQPALFFGGALLLGLAAARFLKASAERKRPADPHDYEPSYPAHDTTGMGSTASF